MQPGFESGLPLSPFFHEEISVSKRELGITVAPEAEMYVVQLLVRYATAPLDVSLDRPLALQWADAHEIRDKQMRRRRFQRLGDAALLKEGILRAPSRDVSSRYIQTIGRTAYTEVARLSTRAVAAAFDALVETFDAVCRLLLEIRLRYDAELDVGGLALVGQGSAAAARRLGDAGLVLLPVADG